MFRLTDGANILAWCNEFFRINHSDIFLFFGTSTVFCIDWALVPQCPWDSSVWDLRLVGAPANHCMTAVVSHASLRLTRQAAVYLNSQQMQQRNKELHDVISSTWSILNLRRQFDVTFSSSCILSVGRLQDLGLQKVVSPPYFDRHSITGSEHRAWLALSPLPSLATLSSRPTVCIGSTETRVTSCSGSSRSLPSDFAASLQAGRRLHSLFIYGYLSAIRYMRTL